MRISVEWLGDFIELDPERDSIADALTLSGTEVERIITLGSGWEGLLVARILEVGAIGGSDYLKVVQLDVGGNQVQVVSGAPNLRVGSLVPFAPPGTKLPSGDQIRERTFMQVQSAGMVLSSMELGLSGEADGIMDLGADGESGVPLTQLIPGDLVLIVEVTANRPDEMSHLGIARELAAILGRPLKPFSPQPAESKGPAPLTVDIEDPDLCPRYVARYIDGITVRPSPPWIQRRLRAVGQRPINNVVDAANYAMFEMGQPLHAFDFDRLDRGLVIRRGHKDEQLLCLDGETRSLSAQALVIADKSQAQAVAGIIGGAAGAVGPGTTRVVIESATFLGTSIRGTSRHLGVRTEASTRFEKQLHPELAALGAARLAQLLQEVAGAGGSAPAVDVYPERHVAPAIRCTPAVFGRSLGTEISETEVVARLEALQFHIARSDGDLVVTPPPFRLDVRMESDLVEEVGRLRGYDSLPSTLPGSRQPLERILPPPDVEWRAREIATGAGFTEVIAMSFASTDDPKQMGTFRSNRLALANPMAADQREMRTTLLPGLTRTIARNAAVGNLGIRIFELGRVFWPRQGQDLPDEARALGTAIHVPPAATRSAAGDARNALLATKGALSRLVADLTGRPLDLAQEEVPGLHPGRSGRLLLDGREIGCLGQLHPDLSARFDVPGAAVLAEVNFDLIADQVVSPWFEPYSRYPAVSRDLAITVAATTRASDAIRAVQELGEVILRSVEIFDEYHGGQLEAGRKGFAFHLWFQAPDRTLRGEEVAAAEKRIVDHLRRRLDARVRD